jgi:hypothetical protein
VGRLACHHPSRPQLTHSAAPRSQCSLHTEERPRYVHVLGGHVTPPSLTLVQARPLPFASGLRSWNSNPHQRLVLTGSSANRRVVPDQRCVLVLSQPPRGDPEMRGGYGGRRTWYGCGGLPCVRVLPSPWSHAGRVPALAGKRRGKPRPGHQKALVQFGDVLGQLSLCNPPLMRRGG